MHARDSPDADGGITSIITGHPSHAHHTSSAGADIIDVAAQGKAQAARSKTVPEH